MLKTPSEFGESAYIALKNNDESGFRTLFVDESDGNKLFVADSGTDENAKEEFDLYFSSLLEGFDATFHDSFSRLREKGIEMGVNWEQVEFKGVDVSEEREEDGLQTADIKTFFTSNDLDFTLSFEEVSKLGDGYKSLNFPSLDPYGR